MREQVIQLICSALRELNEELQYDNLAQPDEATSIFGGTDGIDSLSLVRLVVMLEGETSTTFGRSVPLADEKAMSQRNSPYRTVGSLADFIVRRLEETSAPSS